MPGIGSSCSVSEIAGRMGRDDALGCHRSARCAKKAGRLWPSVTNRVDVRRSRSIRDVSKPILAAAVGKKRHRE